MGNDSNNKKEKSADTIDLKKLSEQSKEALKNAAEKAATTLKSEAEEYKDKAVAAKEEIVDKSADLDQMLKEVIFEYNDSYTLMNDKGVQLFVERSRSIDAIDNVRNLINSIANHPKEFDTEFEKIEHNRKQFKDSCEFADRELKAARQAASGVGAGAAAGASVAFMAPTAAMWIATTFGTASTGAAISTLSGAAATNAALAWLGGGALAAGGGGMAAGNALLALAGPVGWGIAGATLLTSIVIFAKKRLKLNEEKNKEIENVKKNTEIVKEMDAKISDILNRTTSVREKLIQAYMGSLTVFGQDYHLIDDNKKQALGALVNNTLTLSAMLDENVSEKNGESEDNADI